MNKTKFLSIAVIVLVLLNLGTLAFFWMKRPPHPMQEGPKKIIVERLHFDVEQVAAYDKLIVQHQQEVKAKQQEIGAAKTVLYEQLKSDDLSRKDSLIMVIGQVHQQMEAIHFQHFSDLKKLCKDEQIKAFDELTAELAGYFAMKPKTK